MKVFASIIMFGVLILSSITATAGENSCVSDYSKAYQAMDGAIQWGDAGIFGSMFTGAAAGTGAGSIVPILGNGIGFGIGLVGGFAAGTKNLNRLIGYQNSDELMLKVFTEVVKYDGKGEAIDQLQNDINEHRSRANYISHDELVRELKLMMQSSLCSQIGVNVPLESDIISKGVESAFSARLDSAGAAQRNSQSAR